MYLAKNKELVVRFKAGDRDALEEVYLHYAPGVCKFIGRGFTFRSAGRQLHFQGLREQGDLHDVVQEVFRRAFEDKARDAYNGVTSFANWVLAFSRNVVINRFRSREVVMSSLVRATDSRSPSVIFEERMRPEYAGVLYAQPDVAQDVQVERKELKVLIDNFMAQLQEQDRVLLRCRFVQGLGQSATADKIGSSRMRVRSAEIKLRNRLRAFLRDTGYRTDAKQ